MTRTFKDVAIGALTEYVDTLLAEGFSEDPGNRAIAVGGWEAMLDALVGAGADESLMSSFLGTEIEEPAFPLYDEPWGVDPDLGEKKCPVCGGQADGSRRCPHPIAPPESDMAAALRGAAEALLKVAESL